jgi:hypothetical protein
MTLSVVAGAWAIDPAKVQGLRIAPPMDQASPNLKINYKLVLLNAFDSAVNGPTVAVEVTGDPDANSPAGKAGLEKGDMILALGNSPIPMPPPNNTPPPNCAPFDLARNSNLQITVWDHTTGKIVPLQVIVP